MADSRWTPEQEQAIALRGCNILVSAAAGAGKTSVLVERVVRHILDPDEPLDLERMLAVTFTEKAAAEMKQRIRASLEEAFARAPGDQRIGRQLSLLDRSQISTIHAFCLHVVRRYFYKAKLDPSFRVLDQNEAELLRIDALSDLFEALYQDEGETGAAFRDLVDRYGGAGIDEGLQAMILRLHDFARTQASMDGWLDDAVPAVAGSPDEVWSSPWMKVLLARAAGDLGRALSYATQALAVCGEPYGPDGYGTAISDDVSFYRDMAAALARPDAGQSDIKSAVEAILSFKFTRLGRAAKDCDPAKKDLAKELRDAGKDLFGKVSGYAFVRPAADLAREIEETRPLVESLTRIARDLDRSYTEKKLDRGGVDFGDLERYCLSILERDDCRVASEMRKEFDCVLIDEYQDTNPLQERILSLVASQEPCGNRFMVGDLKQSIYRFRLAEPRIFLEKFRLYVKRDEGVRIDLSHNFRSREEVISAVNHLFKFFMKREVAEIEYSDGHELRKGASYPEPGGDDFRAELHLVEREDLAPQDTGEEGQESSGPAESLEEFEALEKEALVVAARIKSLVDPAAPLMLWDARTKAQRPCSFRDIAILMRSTKDRANAVLEVLGRCDIPAYADTGTGYFQAREVEVALSLLRIIDNPRQDIPLAAVLRSPIVGLTPADLAVVRSAFKKGEFYDAVRHFAAGRFGPAVTRGATEAVERARISATLARFLEDLDGWRTMARRRPLAEVLWSILRATSYHDYVGGLPGGAQRQANLRALCDRAREFDSFGRHGLFRFLRFIEKIQDTKGDLGTARALGEHEDVVRVMSIHKAKGLEFPVIFAIDLGKQFNMDDVRHDLLFHRDLGIGLMYCDLPHRVKYPTGLHQAVSVRIKEENLAEEMRVLYVALTRAKEKLIMIGSARDLPGRFDRWGRIDPASATTCLDWICPALMKPGAAASASPISVREWGTPDGNPVPVPGQRTLGEQDLTWRDVRDLKTPRTLNPGVYNEVVRRLTWKYPYGASTTTFAKMSVGEMRRRLEGEEEDSWRTDAAREARFALPQVPSTLSLGVGPSTAQLADSPDASRMPPLAGAARGIAVHSLLSRMRLEKAGSLDGVREEAERLVALGLIESPGLDERDIRRVADFFITPEGQALLVPTGNVLREVPFTMKVPAGMFVEDCGLKSSTAADPGDTVVVQGVIDVLVDEGDGLVILDYKTDDLPESALGARYASYLPQIALYALAAEKILKKPVKRASIVFLSRCRVFDAEWRQYLRATGLL